MKNYVAKLRENQEKGFSLVELIIVMAIMAILVGVVASQVIPYMEKSRQSKDQQQLSSLGTTMVSAIAQNPDTFDQSTVAGGQITFSLSALAANTSTDVETTFCQLMGESNISGVVNAYIGSSATKISSKEGKTATDIKITLDADGAVTVKLDGTTSNKLTIKTE